LTSALFLQNVLETPLYATLTAYGLSAFFALFFVQASASGRAAPMLPAGFFLGFLVLARQPAQGSSVPQRQGPVGAMGGPRAHSRSRWVQRPGSAAPTRRSGWASAPHSVGGYPDTPSAGD
jgi:hypothetical protein